MHENHDAARRRHTAVLTAVIASVQFNRLPFCCRRVWWLQLPWPGGTVLARRSTTKLRYRQNPILTQLHAISGGKHPIHRARTFLPRAVVTFQLA